MTYAVRYAETADQDFTDVTNYIDHVLLSPDTTDHLLETLKTGYSLR